jgi:serine/threonine protein kinase
LKVIPVQSGRGSPPKEPAPFDGVTFTAIREINNLTQLEKSKNVVNMLDAFLTPLSELVIVLEYFEFDLVGLIASCPEITMLGHIKWFFRQAVEAVHQCHSSGLMHRDIKAANLLVNHAGELKLTDFGLMTTFDDVHVRHSQNVVTLWYRAPELLLGDSLYGPAVDLWSLGCVLVELFTKKAPFPGSNEAHQLDLICKMCGTPTDDAYPNVTSTPGYRKLLADRPVQPRALAEHMRALPPDALDLLERLFCLDPRRRVRAQEVLRHPFLTSGPPAVQPPPVRYDSVHEFELRNRKRLVERGSGSGSDKRARPNASSSSSDTSPPPASHSGASSFNSAVANSPHASAITRAVAGSLGGSASGSSSSSLARSNGSTPQSLMHSPKSAYASLQSPIRLAHSMTSPHKRTSPPTTSTSSAGRSPQPLSRASSALSASAATSILPAPPAAATPSPMALVTPPLSVPAAAAPALPPPPPVVVPAGHSANAYLAPAKRKQPAATPANSLVHAAS